MSRSDFDSDRDSDFDMDSGPPPDSGSEPDLTIWPHIIGLLILLVVGTFVGISMKMESDRKAEEARKIAKMIDFAARGYSLSCDRFREIAAARNKKDQVYCGTGEGGEFVATILSTKIANSQVVPSLAAVTFDCNTACLTWVEGGKETTYRDALSLAEVKETSLCRTSLTHSLQALVGTDRQHLIPVLDEAGLQKAVLECRTNSLLRQQRMEAKMRLVAEKEAARAAITFTQKDLLEFREINDGFRASLRKEGASSNILERVAQGAHYLMAEVDLDDDGIPEVVLKHPQCDAKWCDIFVVKHMPNKGYQHISRHDFTGTIGVTNESVCGFRAFFEADKAAGGTIKAAPMNYLEGINRTACDF